ncbi:dTDP-4-dehydrorhamnose reductase [Synergistaceae bacterium OttesenSCG-928-D05]|nr:dTDP-4-dehydrorhamnose reductase [Synergistaceae bacterium OttesenSCG-928-D05]
MTKRPNILIFGKNGQVGYELCRSLSYLGNVSAVDIDECDLTNPSSIQETLNMHNPDVIVNAAAYTAVDKAESETVLARKLNTEAPCTMAEWCARQDALMVHFSTDYVYDGSKADGWLETDPCEPLNVYGKTKLDGDIYIKNAGCRHLIFRTSWVYGAYGRNFYLTMRKMLGEKKEITVVNDQYGAPTWSRAIATGVTLALSQIISPNSPLHMRYISGIYNLTNAGETTWYSFTREIKSYMQRYENHSNLAQITPIDTEAYPTLALRPKYSKLSCEKLNNTFGIFMPSWESALKMVFEESMKDNRLSTG